MLRNSCMSLMAPHKPNVLRSFLRITHAGDVFLFCRHVFVRKWHAPCVIPDLQRSHPRELRALKSVLLRFAPATGTRSPPNPRLPHLFAWRPLQMRWRQS
ncbi:hypothetical protein CEXT_539541 [Caerostris extrusa]|uniref:Uncharacterized protein n=1 Tax=Caerostris extrusa TaxID=172846 RepID=A0AAV4TD15_CAEEX|nr:hypothetical protein CEXT_539541 [Caerostris extrusa]